MGDIVLLKRKNLKLIFYLATCLFYLHMGFMGSTYVLFFYSLGISKFMTNVIISASLVTIFISEIPAGAYADTFGKRKSIILSGVLLVISMLLFTLGKSPIVFIISEIFIGFAYAFISGALDSWIIETMNLKDKEIDKVFANKGKYLNIALIIGGLLGGLVSSYNTRYIWVLSLFSLIIYLILVILFVKESDSPKVNIIENYGLKSKFINGINQMKLTTIESIQYGYKDKNIKRIIMYNCILAFSFSPIFIYWAPLLDQYSKSSIGILGVIWVIIKISNIIGNEILNKIIDKSKFPRENILYITTLLISISIFIAAISRNFIIILIAFIIFEILLGVVQPSQQACINNYIDTDKRATVLSFESMITSGFTYISMIVMGYIGDRFNIEVTWVIVGAVMFIISLTYYFRMKLSRIKQVSNLN